LFGVWGIRRYCSHSFSWNTHQGRENRRRLSAIARTIGQIRRVPLDDIASLKRELGSRWWKELRRLIVSDRKWPKRVDRVPGWVFDALWQLCNPSPGADALYWS